MVADAIFLINTLQERRRLNRLVRLVELERLETTLVSLRERLVEIEDNSDTENVIGDGEIPVSSNNGAVESYIEDDMSVARQIGMEHFDEVLCPISLTLFQNADFENQTVTDSNHDHSILETENGTKFSEEKICGTMDGDLHCLEQVMDVGDIIEENNSQKTSSSPDHSMKEGLSSLSEMTDIKRQSIRSFTSDISSVQDSEVAQNCHDVAGSNNINKQSNHILSENEVLSAAKYLGNSTLFVFEKKAITTGVNSHSDDGDNDNDMLSVSDTEDVVTASTVQTGAAAAGAGALESREIAEGVMETLLPGDLQSGDPEVLKEIAGQADTDFTSSTSTSVYGLQAEIVVVAAEQADVEVEVRRLGLGRILEQGDGEGQGGGQHVHVEVEVEVEVVRNQNVNAPIPIQVIAINQWNNMPAIQLYWFMYDIYFGEPRDNARGPRRDVDEIDFFPLDFSKFFSNHLQVFLVTSFFGFMLLLTLTVPILSMNYLGINGQLFIIRRHFISRYDIYKLHIPMPHTAASAAWWKENCEDADFLYSLFFVYAFSALAGEKKSFPLFFLPIPPSFLPSLPPSFPPPSLSPSLLPFLPLLIASFLSSLSSLLPSFPPSPHSFLPSSPPPLPLPSLLPLPPSSFPPPSSSLSLPLFLPPSLPPSLISFLPLFLSPFLPL